MMNCVMILAKTVRYVSHRNMHYVVNVIVQGRLLEPFADGAV